MTSTSTELDSRAAMGIRERGSSRRKHIPLAEDVLAMCERVRSVTPEARNGDQISTTQFSGEA